MMNERNIYLIHHDLDLTQGMQTIQNFIKNQKQLNRCIMLSVPCLIGCLYYTKKELEELREEINELKRKENQE